MGHKTYPEYRDSGVQWLGEVPSHWETRRLKYAAPLRNIKVVAGESDLPYIGLENIESWSGKYIVQDEANDSEGVSSRFYPGDVLFGKLRPYLAKAFLANFEGACSSELLVLQGKGVQPEFLVRFVLSVGFIREVDSSTYGAKMPRASWEFIGNLPVTLPPTEEQSTITAFLDEKTSQIDQLIEKKTRFIELLKEKRAALITEAVTGKFDVRTGKPYPEYKDSGVEWLGEVPVHWETKKLKYIGKAIIGLTYDPKEISDDGIVVLRATNIQNGFLSLNDVVRVKKQIPTELITKSGDIFICSRNGSRQLIGKNVLIGRPAEGYSFGAFTTVFRSPMNDFVYHVFNSDLFSYQSGLFMTSTVNQLTTSMLNNMEIPLPPACEQEKIVAFLHDNKRQIDQLIEKTQQSIDLLKEKRAALITAAVTGKIDVRDWNTEAA